MSATSPEAESGGDAPGDLTAWRLDEFAGSLTALSERTLAAYRADVGLFAQWVARLRIGEPSEVTRTVVRRYIANLSTRQYAQRSIARKVAALRRYFRWAGDRGLVATDPTLGVQVSAGPGRLPRVLDRRELEGLLEPPDDPDEAPWRRARDDAFP